MVLHKWCNINPRTSTILININSNAGNEDDDGVICQVSWIIKGEFMIKRNIASSEGSQLLLCIQLRY